MKTAFISVCGTGALALALACGAALARGGAREGARDVARGTPREEIAPATPEARAFEARLGEALARAARSPVPAESSAPPAPTAPPPASSPPPPSPEEVVAVVKSAFAAQPRDTTWSTRAERTIQARIVAFAPGAKIECRESACRIESADTPDAIRVVRAATGIPGDELMSGGALSSIEDDGAGGRVRVTYLARAGESLATP